MTSPKNRLKFERFVISDPEIARQYREGVLSRPMTHEQRRRLIETPIVIRVYGQSYQSSGVSLEREGVGNLRKMFSDIYPYMED